jgi:Ser/Thr protein kinase RdoA (MazF antagonist)
VGHAIDWVLRLQINAYPTRHGRSQLRQAVAIALAAFHASTATLQPMRKASPLQAQVMLMVEQAQMQEQVAAAIALIGSIEEQTVVVRWRSLLPVLINYLGASIAVEQEGIEDGDVICHGDLWPAHVYFSNGAFRGFVDFGALTFTTPALDLAQLILHFGVGRLMTRWSLFTQASVHFQHRRLP